jgi:hypothetical protein
MQYLVCGYDGDDEGALDRRLAVRADHLALGDRMVAEGTMLFGVALLDGDRMIGSAIVVDFPTQSDLDHYLSIEPYATQNVWHRIEITPCRVGPSFLPDLAP